MNKITPGYESDRVSDTLGRRAATELFLALEAGSLVDPQTVLRGLEALFTGKDLLDDLYLKSLFQRLSLQNFFSVIDQMSYDLGQAERFLAEISRGLEEIIRIIDDTIGDEADNERIPLPDGFEAFLLDLRKRIDSLR